MGLKRREFLQRASTLLAALGMTEAGLWQAGDRYLQALGAPTSRKLALLIGINDYSTAPDLGGCLTDVELQRELLIHRFGFQRSDILTLTDTQATRKNIVDAFLNHLTKQVQPGDVVVFHFSGYGRYLNQNSELRRLVPDANQFEPLQAGEVTKALVPSDSILNSSQPFVKDLLEDTLLLLLRSLPTEKMIAVLDTSYSYLGSDLLGNLRVRSRPFPETSQPSAEELVLQQQLLARILPKEPQINLNQLRGFVLTAAGPEQVATEMQLAGFSTGLFTYALTQQLWQATPATTLQFSLQQAACTVGQLAGVDHQPQLKGDPVMIQTEKKFSLFDLNSLPAGVEGALKSVEEDGRTAQLWLAGLPVRVLASYGTNSLLRILPATSPDLTSLLSLEEQAKNGVLLQVRSRNGLNAQVQKIGTPTKETSPLKAGQFVQEMVRVLPRNPNLIVALDTGLERIERVDATSAFSGISFVTPVVAGEQTADCLFGRVRETLVAQSSSPSFPSLIPGSYGLFWLGQDLISDTMGEGGEAVKAAVRRLVPQMQTLLAAKLWRLSNNEASSRLAIHVSLERLQENQTQVLTEKKARRAVGLDGASSGLTANGPAWKKPSVITIPAGSRIQYRLKNESPKDLYFLLFGLDNRGRAYVGGLSEAVSHYPKQLSDPNDFTQFQEAIEYNQIAPGDSLTIPWVVSGSGWRAGNGLAETHIICSPQPFYRTMAALAATMPPRADSQALTVLSNPLPVAQGLMQDLHQASEAGGKLAGVSADNSWALDVNRWATLSFLYQVI